MKSAISFSKGTSKQTQDQIIKELGINRIGGFGKYLGLPEHIVRNWHEAFQYITQRIKNKLENWYSKFLFPAGKEVLLKAVITALPAYTMSCFLLPKTTLKEITKAMEKFWWSADMDRKPVPWIAWDKITNSKKERGLGIRDMLAFNKALLAKQAWRIITHSSSFLSRVYKAKYFQKTTSFEASSYQSSSYAWRSIIQTLPLIKKGVKWVVGNGEKIRAWQDKWLFGEDDQLSPTGPGAESFPFLLVKDLFVSGTKTWDIPKISSLFRQEDVNKILKIRPSYTGNQDILYWRYGTTGKYSVKTGYHLQKNLDREAHMAQIPDSPHVSPVNNMLARLWRINIPPKIKMFWWKVFHNGVPVLENLVKRGSGGCNICMVCGEESESVDHMLVRCRVAKEVWSLALNDNNASINCTNTSTDLYSYCLQRVSKDPQDTVLFFLGWRIWKMRNKLVYENRRDHIIQVLNAAYVDVKIWKEALTQREPTARIDVASSINSVQEILPHNAELYCIVDASWKSPKDKIGIGWSLYSKDSTPRLQGSTAMEPTSSPFGQ